jgi:hypothetical protein
MESTTYDALMRQRKFVACVSGAWRGRVQSCQKRAPDDSPPARRRRRLREDAVVTEWMQWSQSGNRDLMNLSISYA